VNPVKSRVSIYRSDQRVGVRRSCHCLTPTARASNAALALRLLGQERKE
jgi:hypothetical protein